MASGGLRQLDNYLQASIQEPVNVLGLNLNPFSLGHLFLMRRYECPFASDDPNEMAGCGDLMLACVICSRTYEEFLEFIHDIDFKWLNEWDKKVSKWFRKKQLDALEEFQKFNNYRQTALYIPYVSPTSSDPGTPSGAHWSMTIYQFMTKELGYTTSEALNMPLAQAIVEYYKALETMGCVTLMNDFECAVIEGEIRQ
jgi:hypothetical protein